MLYVTSLKVKSFSSVPSTQDLMRQHLVNGEKVHGLVIRAAIQTAGRGQRKHNWQSPLGGSYQTLAIKDSDCFMLQKPYAALPMAIGLANVFSDYGIQLGIKWPNDLYYKGKKTAGILCEYLKRHLLIGVGVNVNNEFPKGAASLKGLSTEAVSDVVLEGLLYGVNFMARATPLPKAFARFDLLYGQEISIEFQGKLKSGIAKGINENGFLKLKTKEGCTCLPYGQVSICHYTLNGG